MQSILIIYSASAEHLGLFNDIKNSPNVLLVKAQLKDTKFRLIQRIHLSSKFHLPYKYLQYNYSDIPTSNIKAVVVMGTALEEVDYSYLAKIKRKGGITILYLIDSLDASSPKIQYCKYKINLFKWDYIFTFDTSDARNYGYRYLGFNYYSKHSIPSISKPLNDIYFVGGLKGNRTKLIYQTYNHLTNNDFKADFNVMKYSKKIEDDNLKNIEGIKYIINGWMSYHSVLAGIANSKCLIEILQEGQHGPSLRYFEAVCYNKKLLTNNPLIINYPYYNSKYMKIFKNINDIDLEWLRKDDEIIDYNYKGDFSPINLITFINKL